MKKGTIADLTPDPKNANAGTERGSYMLTTSIERCGLGRGVLADVNGWLVAGNKTTEAAAALGLEKTIEIESDGTELIVVKRKDLDLSAPTHTEEYQRARELSVADNQTSLVGYLPSAPVLVQYIGEGVDLDPWFLPNELEEILTNDLSKTLEESEGNMGDRPEKEIDCTCPNCGEKFTRTL